MAELVAGHYRIGAKLHFRDGLDITPPRQTARTGRFRLQVANTGTADVTLAVEGRDTEEACRFRLGKDGTLRVGAAGTAELPLSVVPRSRPWVGPDRTYDFTLSARPVDARGEPQATTGRPRRSVAVH